MGNGWLLTTLRAVDSILLEPRVKSSAYKLFCSLSAPLVHVTPHEISAEKSSAVLELMHTLGP